MTEKTPEQIAKEKETQQKEENRKYQLGFLNSDAMKNLYIASQGRNVEMYGKLGKLATQGNYINALGNADEYVSKLTTMPYLQSAMKAQENGEDIYESGVSSSHAILLKNASAFYQSAITKVKVSDVLGMLSWKNVHEKNISGEDKNMFMEDFAKKNKEAFGLMTNSYFGTVADMGVAQAIIESRARQNKGLEIILSEEPKKEEGGEKKK